MSNYECYCEPSDGESCDLWRQSWRKAKKPYICIECKDTIKPGDRYSYTFLVYCGESDSFRRCEFCENEADRIMLATDLRMVPGDLACALVAELRGDL